MYRSKGVSSIAGLCSVFCWQRGPARKIVKIDQIVVMGEQFWSIARRDLPQVINAPKVRKSFCQKLHFTQLQNLGRIPPLSFQRDGDI